MGGGPATSDDLKKQQESRQAAAAAQALLDQNARVGPGSAAGGNAASASPYPGRQEGEDTIGMLRRKYGMGNDDESVQQILAALGTRAG